MTEINENEALKRMEAYCASAEHCRTEVTDKLLRWGLPYDTANRIVDRLEQEKFIDEERYCNAFIRDKFRFAKWGKQRIDQALRLKKIDPYTYRPLLNRMTRKSTMPPCKPCWMPSGGASAPAATMNATGS